MYKMCGNNVKLKFLFLWHLIAIICFLSINTSSSTDLKLNNNNHRIIDDSNDNNDSNKKENNFVSGYLELAASPARSHTCMNV